MRWSGGVFYASGLDVLLHFAIFFMVKATTKHDMCREGSRYGIARP